MHFDGISAPLARSQAFPIICVSLQLKQGYLGAGTGDSATEEQKSVSWQTDQEQK